jgi:L-gulonolactone oxidase
MEVAMNSTTGSRKLGISPGQTRVGAAPERAAPKASPPAGIAAPAEGNNLQRDTQEIEGVHDLDLGLRRPEVKNWNGQVSFSPGRLVTPKSLAELQKVVAQAKKVRVQGAGHSMSDIIAASKHATLINLSNFNKVGDVVPSADGTEGRVTVECGATLGELTDALGKQGYTLSCLPSFPGITVGGAISTGAHGSARSGPAVLADEIESMQVIDAKGQLCTLSGDDLRAARVSMGTMGAIVNVTLRCVKAFDLVETDTEVPEDQFLKDLPQTLADNEHLWISWKPDQQQFVVRAFNQPTGDVSNIRRVDSMDLVPDQMKAFAWQMYEAARKDPELIPDLLSFYGAFPPKVGRADHIFYLDAGWLPGSDTSISIPVEKTEEAINQLRQEFNRIGYHPNLPIWIRFLPASDKTDLGMNSGRSVAVFELISGNDFPDYPKAQAAFEKVMKGLGARPHWAKSFDEVPKGAYPDQALEHFEQVRRRMDPDGKFDNDWAKRNVPTLSEASSS